MASLPVKKVSIQELDAVVQSADFSGRKARLEFIARRMVTEPATNEKYEGGMSEIWNYYTRSGSVFVAQEHVIVMPDGREAHRHLRMIDHGGFRYLKADDEQPFANRPGKVSDT